MSTARAEVLAELAAAIPRPVDHPVRVAIDGMIAVGKTTMRSELADALRASGRVAVEASGDDFHQQREYRYRDGRRTGFGYYEYAYDYAALADKLLVPLGPGGDRRVRLRHHDLATDQILDAEPVVQLDVDTVLVVDGSFLQRPEVAPHWDFLVLVEAPRDVSVARLVIRNGAPSDPKDDYHLRYFGGYDAYVAACDPRRGADLVLDNTDWARPRIVRT
jgi:uridine kinase